jgi:hypothetical protein
MANTTNYNWETPDDTDLVKDGAAAIRTLGSSVDTTTKALNPSTTLGDIEYRSATANTNTRLGIGTTGQVLTVAGGVPTWATSDDANAIQNALLTTTGDTIYASGASTPARLGIGTTGQVLTVAGGVPSWATPAGGGGKVLQVVEGTLTGDEYTTSTTFADSGLSVSITPSSASSKVYVMAMLSSAGKYDGATGNALQARLNRDSTSILFVGDRVAFTNANDFNYISVALNKLDSPATTSAITYKVQFASKVSGQTAVINSWGSSDTLVSTIIAMEIGA